MELTPLEAAVLDMLLAGDDPWLAILREQRRLLHVTGREHSGVGFSADLAVPADAPKLPGGATVRFGDVSADIDGLEQGAGFLLFIDGGVITVLEGYLYGDAEWPVEVTKFTLRYDREPRDLAPLH
ncbi:MAG TPA: hypothetical protein VFV99_05310 [Kofleriaceae bacterium]|nr:hypothetical protein [Kofleriaceae bacterium]